MRLQRMMLFDKPAHLGEITKEKHSCRHRTKDMNRCWSRHEAQLSERPKCAFSCWPRPECLASPPPRRRMLFRRVQASDRSGWAPHPALSRCGAAAARVGTQCPVIGANGGVDGFRRIARQTGITATKVHTRVGEVLTTEAGVRPGVGTARMGAEATTAVDGAIPSVAPGHCCDCRG
jgi:hypothetical protein